MIYGECVSLTSIKQTYVFM